MGRSRRLTSRWGDVSLASTGRAFLAAAIVDVQPREDSFQVTYIFDRRVHRLRNAFGPELADRADDRRQFFTVR